VNPIPRSWPSWITVLVVVPIAYLSLLVVLRVAGKRTLSKLTAYGLAGVSPTRALCVAYEGFRRWS
jgi:hypothetical protein